MWLSGFVARLLWKPSQLKQWPAITRHYHGFCWPTSTCHYYCSTVSIPVSVLPTSGTAHTLIRQHRLSTAAQSRNQPSQWTVDAVPLSTMPLLTTTKWRRTTVSSNDTLWAAINLCLSALHVTDRQTDTIDTAYMLTHRTYRKLYAGHTILLLCSVPYLKVTRCLAIIDFDDYWWMVTMPFTFSALNYRNRITNQLE